MKKTTLALLIFAVLFLFSAFTFEVVSTGAPPSSTGAPDEVSCAIADCHSDFSVNSGTAQLELETTISEQYTPGQQYTITVKLSDEDVVRFGYELTVLDDNNDAAGTLVITDPDRTQIVQNFIELLDRRYATYTFAGTAALQTGYTEWTFDWLAPANSVGDVHFYLAGVSADDDGTDNGDHVYTLVESVEADSPVNVSDLSAIGNITLYPNPASDHLQLNFSLANPSNVIIDLVDLDGKVHQTLHYGPHAAGPFSETISLPQQLPSGVYLVSGTVGTASFTKKVFIQ